MFLSPLFRKAVLCCAPLALLGGFVSANAQLVTNGAEYSISGPLSGDQIHASLAIGTNGGFLVVEDNAVDGSGQGIGAIALDSNYHFAGRRFRVNQNRSGDQENPQAVLLNGGGTVFVWQSRPLRSRGHVFARFLSSSNTWLTGDIMVNTSTKDAQVNPVVAALPNGNVVIAYGSYNQVTATSMQDVYATIFSPTGQRLSSEFLVNQFATFNQRTPAVAALGNGGFVVLWVSEQQRFERVVDIYGRLYDASGNPAGGEFIVNTGNTNACANPAVAATPEGGFIAAWSELQITSRDDAWDAFARQFSAAFVSGTASQGGSVVRLNSYTFGDQYAPKVMALSSGTLAIWTSKEQDGSREGIYGRYLDASGVLSGEEFRVNDTIAGAQKFSAVGTDNSARIIAAWSSFNNIQSGFDVYAKMFAAPDYVPTLASTNFTAPTTDPFPTDNPGGGPGSGGGGGPTGGTTSNGSKGAAALKGVYYGEFFDTNDVNNISEVSGGSFTATINAKGGYSAKLILGGKTFATSGKVGSDGRIAAAINKRGVHLTLQLQVDLNGGNQISGTVSDGSWTVYIDSRMLTFSKKGKLASNYSGSYTLRIPADAYSSNSPAGDGFASVKVDAGGKVQIAGIVADGTKFSQKTGLSEAGYFPMFSSLYGGKGCLIGWLHVVTNGLDGPVVTWSKALGAKSKNYSDGFTNHVEAIGWTFNRAVSNTRAMKWSDGTGELLLVGAGFDNVTNGATATLNGKIVGSAQNRLKLNIVPATGIFKGSIRNPGTGKTMQLQGAIDQADNTGFGFFLNNGESGQLILEDAP